MNFDGSRQTIQEKFQHLFAVVSSERFLKKQGIGNEVPFFICPYNPSDANESERSLKKLVTKLAEVALEYLMGAVLRQASNEKLQTRHCSGL